MSPAVRLWVLTRWRSDAPSLLFGLMVGVIVYVILQLTDTTHIFAGVCTECWVSAVDRPDVVAAVTAAGSTVGEKAVKDMIDKGARGPITSYKTMYDIASQDTPEGQAEEAWKAYKNLIMTDKAPPGSTGDEINKAIDRFFEFSKDPDL